VRAAPIGATAEGCGRSKDATEAVQDFTCFGRCQILDCIPTAPVKESRKRVFFAPMHGHREQDSVRLSYFTDARSLA
jgi:hypothetical protein